MGNQVPSLNYYGYCCTGGTVTQENANHLEKLYNQFEHKNLNNNQNDKNSKPTKISQL